MRLNIDEIMELSREKRIKYVGETSKALIRVKKMGETEMYPVKANYRSIVKSNNVEIKANVQSNILNYQDADSIDVSVVANTSNWIDYQLDLILPGAPKKSIQENKGFIPHIKNHSRNINDRVAIVKDIYEKMMPVRELGIDIDIDGMVSALIFESEVIKNFDEKVFWQYVHKQVNQHSISLQYIDIRVCLDDENRTQEYENYKKYIKEALNPEVAEESGFFWAIPEYRLIENSAVLFAAHKLTPTLDDGKSLFEDILSQNEAEQSPQKTIEPSKDTLQLINNFKL